MGFEKVTVWFINSFDSDVEKLRKKYPLGDDDLYDFKVETVLLKIFTGVFHGRSKGISNGFGYQLQTLSNFLPNEERTIVIQKFEKGYFKAFLKTMEESRDMMSHNEAIAHIFIMRCLHIFNFDFKDEVGSFNAYKTVEEWVYDVISNVEGIIEEIQ